MHFYCPTCGKNLKEAPLSTSAAKRVGIYALSLLLPPLGLWPGIKYIRQNDPKVKKIGWIAIILTIISLLVTSWISIGWLNDLNAQLSGQLKQLQNL